MKIAIVLNSITHFAVAAPPGGGGGSPTPSGGSTPISNNIIVTHYITPAINFLSIGVGVIVVAMIIIGAIQYSSSGGNPQTVSAAKKKITNAILALVFFAFSYAFLNFLIPGGLVKL